MLDLEISLVQRHHWSLKDIDETDVTSLLMFAERYAETEGGQNLTPGPSPKTERGEAKGRSSPTRPKGRGGRQKRAYIDQLNWS